MIVALVAFGIAGAVMLIAAGILIGYLIGRRTKWTPRPLEAVREAVVNPPEEKRPDVEPQQKVWTA